MVKIKHVKTYEWAKVPPNFEKVKHPADIRLAYNRELIDHAGLGIFRKLHKRLLAGEPIILRISYEQQYHSKTIPTIDYFIYEEFKEVEDEKI